MSRDEQRQRIDDDEVARLVRRAAPAEAPSPERVARAMEATRAHWRREHGRRPRTRRWQVAALAAAAVVVLAIALQLMVGPHDGAGIDWPRIASVTGHGFLAVDDAATARHLPLKAGTALSSGETIGTEADDRVALLLASGASIRLDRGTRLRLEPSGALTLDRGAVYLDSGVAGRLPRVETRWGTFEDVGTQFEVRLIDDAVRLRVREGKVRLASVGAERTPSQLAEAGTEWTLDDRAEPRRRAIASHGEEWAWVESLSPAFDIDGRTARSFLDWLVRERGLELVFADPAAARRANDTVLNGTIEGLSLDEALETVLPTCGLTARQDAGLLIVEQVPGEDAD